MVIQNQKEEGSNSTQLEIGEFIKKDVPAPVTSTVSTVSPEKSKEDKEKKHEEHLREKARKLSIKEGSFASVMSGFGDSYISPFAIALKASNAQIGFLSSFTGLVSPLSQLFGSKLMEKYSRRKLIFVGPLIQGLMWFPMLLLGLMLWKNMLVGYLPYLLILFYALYAIAGAIAGPSWFSLMGDLVPSKIRGKYFSHRNRICGTIALVATLIGAFFLDFFKTKGILLIGFSILFAISGIARVVSAFLLRKHYEPKLELKEGYYFSFWQFVKKMPYNNFGRFTLFIALLTFATNVAGPFFNVYMLRDLNLSYTMYMLINISATIVSLLFLPIAGKLSDKYGNREMMKFGSIFIILVPVLWAVSKNPLYLILIPQVLSGIGWTAFNLAASNFIYDSVTVQRRGICVAYYGLVNGIGVFLGASIGGLLITIIPITFMNPILFLFVVSGILRLFATLIMVPRIKEVREVKKPKSNPLYYFLETKNFMHGRNGMFHFVFDMKSKLFSKNPKNVCTSCEKD